MATARKAPSPRVRMTTMDSDQIKERLIHNEEAVDSLSSRFSIHETFVHKRFQTFDDKLDNIEKSSRVSENNIIAKLNSLEVASSNTGKTSWPLVISVCVLVMSIVGWGMKQQQGNAVNEAIVQERYVSQQKTNDQVYDWRKALTEKQLGTEDDFKDIRTNYYEHREGVELENLVDQLITRLNKSETEVATLQSEHKNLKESVDRNTRFSDE
jgi:hypothetical protein